MAICTTRTGNFPIGFRQVGSDWQANLADQIAFARDNDFACIDIAGRTVEQAKQIIDAGLAIGSADLLDWPGLCTSDAEKRKKTIEKNVTFIKGMTAIGVKTFFYVVLPGDPTKPRTENFALLADALSELTEQIASTGAKIVIEGWPGPGVLACTPEGYRAIIKQTPGDTVGINYDPSHLIRVGIDPLRFLKEFAPHVYHVHGKDTEIFPELIYELGTQQPPTFAEDLGWGGPFWRYTIPGHGCSPWSKLMAVLVDAGYKGFISIELEDKNYNGSEAGEKTGFLTSRNFLQSI